jgi:hypothetical protein
LTSLYRSLPGESRNLPMKVSQKQIAVKNLYKYTNSDYRC